MTYVVKAAPQAQTLRSLSFNEKTMYKGNQIRRDDTIYIFASDHEGGNGLVASGTVTSVEPGLGSRVKITVKTIARARRPLGRPELKPYRERTDDQPDTEIARKLYRQATNKIAGISDAADAFLNSFF